MPNYKNGKTYIIWNTTAPVYKVYYGSTARELYERMSRHKNDKTCESRSIIESGTYDYQILEYFPCNTKRELQNKEAEYITSNWDSCVNKTVPGAIHRAGGIKEYKKQYRQKNAEKIAEYNKQYRQKNAEKIAEKIAAQQKQYRQQNAEKISVRRSQKIECNLCGSMCSRRNIATHRKTKKCREAVKSQVTNVLNDMIKQIC